MSSAHWIGIALLAAAFGLACSSGCGSTNTGRAGNGGNPASGAPGNGGSGGTAVNGGTVGVAGSGDVTGGAGSTQGGSAGVSSLGGGSSGGSDGAAGSASACAAGQQVVPVYPSNAWMSDANTIGLYRLGNLVDASPEATALTNNGAVTFTHAGLDWSSYSTNDVAHFNGTGQSLTRTGITVGNEFTLEARVFWNGFQNRACGQPTQIIALTSGNAGLSFEQPCGVATGPRVRVNSATALASAATLDAVMDYAWHTVSFVITGGSASFYVDGAKLGQSAPVDSLGSAGFTLTLGKFFNGDIDQVRLSKIARVPTAAAPTVQTRPAYSEVTGDARALSLTSTVAGGAAPKIVWSVVSGPGSVLFANPNAPSTTATFCMPGKYLLQAQAYDAAFSVNDYVVVRVWPSAGRSEPYKTLFIGNSFSFYNGTVGYRYWEFSKAAGEKVGDNYAQSPYVKMLTSPGQDFQYHWFQNNANSECTTCADHVLPAPPTVNLTDYPGKNAQVVVREGGWDIVFLHTYSSAPATDPDPFFRYGKKLDRLIKRSGARTIFYQTWGYPADNVLAVEETILTSYELLAAQTGASLSKVGRAFQDVRVNHGGNAAWPDGMFFTDSKHPSSFGTYLAGALHYATAYGKSPVPLKLYPAPGDVPAPEMSKDNARADLMRSTAAKFAAPP
jgi:hypothetical protein